ncbi:N-alpha-acetyltransferase 30 [Frankliniella fusca]|uniref:N-alpha-acetyltransferase 30 n=1 Tax=Frankliniella fusca TaxID=407009 RepID=A0AAE1LQT4_9NEOP|nr:N-alpha-acetyltransferase 30 [Frankliniella fusca]
MTTETNSEESTKPGDNWFKALIRPIVVSFQRNPCNGACYELGLESSLVVYFATAYGFKRKEPAFRYAMIALIFVPLVTW